MRSGLRKEVELTQERIGFPQIRMRKLEVNKSARTHGLRKGKRNSKAISNLEKEGRKKRAKRHTPPSLPPKKPMRVKQNIFSPLSRAVQSRRILPPSQYDGSAIFFFPMREIFRNESTVFPLLLPPFCAFWLSVTGMRMRAKKKKHTHNRAPWSLLRGGGGACTSFYSSAIMQAVGGEKEQKKKKKSANANHAFLIASAIKCVVVIISKK